MSRGAIFLVGVSYAGMLLLGALGVWVLEGGGATTTPPNSSAWDFATSVFFVTTLVTTVGYGSVTPLSAAGRAFCAAYAAVAVPVTMLTLTAAARRLTGPLADRPRLYLQARWGYSRRGAARAHFAISVGVVLVGLVLLPAGVFYLLEEAWTYLDAVYFCVISLCTIGLGDLVPAQRAGQPLRQIYQVAVAAYLLLGLTGILLLAQTFSRLAELHGAAAILAPPEAAILAPGETDGLLDGAKAGEKKEARGAPVAGGGARQRVEEAGGQLWNGGGQ